MAMFIVKPWYRKASPDDYFDPVTHIATEENFIKFLKCGVYDSKYIGYKVQLGNSVDYNNGLWVIADVNHDSANTGQTDCYDLISEQLLANRPIGSTTYRSCTLRTWLIGSFFNGFNSDVIGHMLNIKYNSRGTWYADDKIILPSQRELNGYDSSLAQEGIPYPIFTDNNSRIKISSSDGQPRQWWTRTRGSQWVMPTPMSDGSWDIAGYDWGGVGISPIIRVH